LADRLLALSFAAMSYFEGTRVAARAMARHSRVAQEKLRCIHTHDEKMDKYSEHTRRVDKSRGVGVRILGGFEASLGLPDQRT
jgi:hypothetical protein